MRSASIMTVRLRTVDGVSGMIEASTTRIPLVPLTAPTASTTACGSAGPPMGGGAGVVVGGQVAGDERGQGAVVGDCVAGGQLVGDERGEVRAAGEVAGELDAFQHPAGVTAGGKEVAVDERGGAGVAAGQLHRPGGLGQDHRGGQRDHSASGSG